MTPTSESLFMGYFPLWGTVFDSEGVGVVGGNVAAYIPAMEEWRQITKTDVWMERWRNAPQSEGPPPPLCLVILSNTEEKEDPGAALQRLAPAMIEAASGALLSLRLLKPGWFLDPALAERVFTFGPFNQRLVGPYRQAFMNGVPAGVPQGYQLSIDELGQSLESQSSVGKVWQLVQRYRQGKPHSSADIAIENFESSYGYQLPSSNRATVLFMALDAIFGGMSAPRFKGVEINSSFRDRITAALHAVGHGFDKSDPAAEATWLDARGREIRNAVAHGNLDRIAIKAEKNWPRIQQIVRLALRLYLEFSVKWASRSAEIVAGFALPESASPAAAFNKVLEAQAFGARNALDLLRLEIST